MSKISTLLELEKEDFGDEGKARSKSSFVWEFKAKSQKVFARNIFL